ncbi:DUF2092 domain-containing protein [Burkholderia sp. SRS-W-2-2016]|uniref:DUF2092 domain-containing protein n=1 Tax=Burkholderia sp. SRS-W-2-2016 TaxID=1926878 RepID=UPI000B0298ED|nr:DUF2092 domain-containing protein [Burkholderia sp. SRS-W-2-2016]
MLRRFKSALLIAALCSVSAQPAYPQQPSTPQQQTASQAQARAILMRMAEFLANAKAFSVSVRSGYDAVQPSGQKIEFGELRNITVSRPDRLRVESERSDGTRTVAVFDGKDIIVVDAANNVYATKQQPGNVDVTLVHFVRDLHLRFPMAMLLTSRLPAEFEERVRQVDYVEKTNIEGVPTHHIAARTDTVDFQVWIADGNEPYPVRVVLTYKNAPGQPQFWGQLSNWNFAPKLADDTFVVKIPDGAKKIAFAADIPTLPSNSRRSTPATGGTK